MEEMKVKILERCQLGYIIAGDIGRSMSGNEEIIRPWDLYPEMFEKEKEAYELERFKEKRREYVEEINRRREV